MSSNNRILINSKRPSIGITGPIPDPPVFSSKTAKFTVPPYFAFQHAETQWLINMMKSNSWDRIWRVALTNPDYFSQTYVQIPDCPDIDNGDPMFHKRAVLYLTPLGLAIYLRKHILVRRLLEFRTDEGLPLVSVHQQLYVANVYEKNPICSDLQVIFPFCVLFRREAFDSVRYLLHAGWKAHEGFVLPYRRAYRLFLFEYKDFLDYSISQMTAKANLRLPNLIYKLIASSSDNFSLWEYEQVETIYQGTKFDDYVSIPRRMLRFIYYFDKDLRLACQILRCIKIITYFHFFFGSCNNGFNISYVERRKVPTNKEMMLILDQDCCIALLIAIFYRAISLRHSQTEEKLAEILIDILIHTHWLCHFLVSSPALLCDHFENLIEKVSPLKYYLFDIIRISAINRIKANTYPVTLLPELEPKGTTKADWENAIETFMVNHKDAFGKYIPP